MRHRTALVLAMVFPTFMAILCYIVLPNSQGGPNRPLQAAYGLGKVLQFSFPLLYLFCCDRSQLRFGVPSTRGLVPALAFGLATGMAGMAMYFLVLKGTSPFLAMGVKAHAFIDQGGLSTRNGYVGLAVFFSLVHSLAEEYYWRWFIFGQMSRSLPWRWSAVIDGLAFMGHHMVLLYHYMPDYFWPAVVPLSLGVAVGGMVWCWLYQRWGSLYAVWASHLLVDAAIFVIGYDLLAGK